MTPQIVTLEALAGGVQHLATAAQNQGHRLTICTQNPDWYPDLGNRADFCHVDTDNYQATKKAVQELGNVKGLFSPTDGWAIAAATLAADLDLPVLNDKETVSWYRDKTNVHAAAGEGYVSTLDEGPYIVKPTVSTGSIGVRIVESLARAKMLADITNGTVERYEMGPLYSAEVYVRDGQIALLGITNRIVANEPAFVETLKGFPHLAGSEWEYDAYTWILGLLPNLKPWQGFLHVEFIETKAGLRLVEINPRLGGALIGPAIVECTNFNPYDYTITDALGQPKPLPERITRRGGHAHVSVYTQLSGNIDRITGPERFHLFPGETTWTPGKKPGDQLTGVIDYRARLGHVVCTRPHLALAQDTALAAARTVTAQIAPVAQTTTPHATNSGVSSSQATNNLVSATRN